MGLSNQRSLNMKVYAGIDLHSNNNYLVLLDDTDKIIYQKRLSNDLQLILEKLKPYKESIVGIVIESTYNWYWLVDGLKADGYNVHLANTTAIAQYSGLKYSDDKTDAIWLARLLRLKLLVEGHIYPKQKRGLRELLRRRMILVRQQTMTILGIQSMITRYEGVKISARNIKDFEKEKILSNLTDEHVRFATTSQLNILDCLMTEIKHLEEIILDEIKEEKQFKLLTSIPGIGAIIAMTILIETGNVDRFKQAGNYSSYCRCVDSKRLSNGKKKGENNRKNGNAYLSWAFIEAANYAIRFNDQIKKYYQKKSARTKRVIALKTVANKLSKACYFMLRDGVEFDINKAFR